MEDFQANCIVLWPLLGSYLSDINKLIPLWHYGILLPEEKKYFILSYLLNLTTDELKKILEFCGHIINNNIVKFVRSPSGYGGNFSESMFLLENSLSNNYFPQMSLSSYIMRNKNEKCISLVLVLNVIQKLILQLNFNILKNANLLS